MVEGSYNIVFLTLPWPSPQLSPNSRGHWSKKATAAAQARADAITITRAEGNVVHEYRKGDLLCVTWGVFQPDNRKRDLDNIMASMKPYQDGVFDALKINDAEITRASIVRVSIDKDFPRITLLVHAVEAEV